MKLSEFIAQAQQLAAHTNTPDDPELMLFDRHRGVELEVKPDDDRFDFEVMRGDDCIVIEFD